MNAIWITALLWIAPAQSGEAAVAPQSPLPAETTAPEATPPPAPSPVSAILLRATADPRLSPPAVELELAAAGPAFAPELLGVLKDGAFVIPIEEGQSFRLALRADLEPAVIGALCRMPRAALLEQLKAVAGDVELDRGRAPALEVLAALGRGEELALAVRLASAGEAAVESERCAAFEHSARQILRREPAAAIRLEKQFPALAPELACAWVRALGSLPRAAAIDPLTDLLARRSDADGWILSEIAAVGEGDPRSLLCDVPDSVRACLGRTDTQVVQAAIRACRALEDSEAVPDLISLMHTAEPPLAASACAALRHIARIDLGRDPARWREWFERESSWWRSHSEEAAQMILSANASEASAAILSLGRTRLHRHQAAEILCLGAERPEPGLARMSCGALGDLLSPRGINALRLALRRPEPGVRDAARKSLQRLERAYAKR